MPAITVAASTYHGAMPPPLAGAARLPPVRFLRLFVVFAMSVSCARQCDEFLKIWLPKPAAAQGFSLLPQHLTFSRKMRT
jgi:hypothetical protein